MKTFFTILSGVVAVAFAGAGAMAQVPQAKRDQVEFWTAPASDVARGQFTEKKRPGLFQPMRYAPVYAAPQMAWATGLRLLDGLVPRNWVSFAPASDI